MTKWERRLTWVWVAFFVWVVWMVCRGRGCMNNAWGEIC